jgi:REP element-mobilizing transposase RayT
MKQNKGYANLRKGRYSEKGLYYHIVITTKNRARIFENFTLARKAIHCLKDSDTAELTETLSFMVMPDHIHWLLILRDSSISKCIQRMKSQFSRVTGLKVWQEGFYDHGIRSDDSLINIARYIVANPLRAGLVESIGEYPHWDSVWL